MTNFLILKQKNYQAKYWCTKEDQFTNKKTHPGVSMSQKTSPEVSTTVDCTSMSSKVTWSDAIDGGDRDDEAILSGASAFHLGEQLLLDGVHQLRTEVPRVKHDLVIKRNVVKHCGKTLSDPILKNLWFSIGVLWSLDALFKSLIMVNWH